MPEVFANNAASTLNAGINNSVTSLVVVSAAAFPTTGNFRILIDSELMLVTGVSGSTFTVTRAVEGTSAASHLAAAAVTQLLTNGSLQQFRADTIIDDTFPNLPAAAITGRLFISTGGTYVAVDSGSAWSYFGPVYPVKPPTPGDWSWFNQGASTLDSTKGYMHVAVPGGSTANLRGQTKTLPAAPYTLTFAIQALNPVVNNSTVFVGVYDPIGGKLVTLDLFADQTGNTSPQVYFLLNKWTTVTTYSASYNFISGTTKLATQGVMWGQLLWVQIADDGTTRRWRVGVDGVHFTEVANQTNTDFVAPTNVVFGGNPNANASWETRISLVSYTES